MKKTGLAGIFAASLELTKEGIVKIAQKEIFEKVLIKKLKMTNKKDNKKDNKNNVINFPTGVTKLERQIEAILFAASEPLDIETIEKRIQTTTNITKNFRKD